ncbi:MAG TPA: nitronate monooxygenase [Yaniella sp.]
MEFSHPIVAAPMAGGPSSTALARAVASTGALGFLGGGNKTAEQLQHDYRAVADAGDVGVNLFVPDVANTAVDPVTSQEGRVEQLAAFRQKLLPFAERLGVELPTVEEAGADVSDDWDAKLNVADEWPIISFTFGLPAPEVFEQLHASNTQVGVTVTTVAEAQNAVAHGADFLVVQGPEAGGHRSVHNPQAEPEDIPLLKLLDRVHAVVDVPLVAAGGIVTPEQVREVRAHGAAAASVGTALLLSEEAGTNPIHRQMLQEDDSGVTQLTRVYSGRVSRSLVNEFMSLQAPPMYPEVNALTVPIKRAAAAAMDPRSTHLFAGTGYRQARTGPAAEIVEWLAGNRP